MNDCRIDKAGARRLVGEPPPDPRLIDLATLLPPSGAPEFVAQVASEMAGFRVEPQEADLWYVNYRPTIRCKAVWSFETPAQPLMVAAILESSNENRVDRLNAQDKRVPWPEGQLWIHRFPCDAALPGLAMSVSRDWARKALAVSLDVEPSEITGVEIDLVRYVPHKRAVLRYDAHVAGESFRTFAKTVSGIDHTRSNAALLQLQQALRLAKSDLRVAAPLSSKAYFADTSTVLLGTMPDVVELKTFVAAAADDHFARQRLFETISMVASVLPDLQRANIDALPVVTSADRIRKLTTHLGRVEAVAPGLAQRVTEFVGKLTRKAGQLPAEKLGLAHGAFRHSHLARGGDGLLLFDADHLRLSGVTLDAAEFLANLAVTGMRNPEVKATVAECARIFFAELPKDWHRGWIAWHRTTTFVKYALRPLLLLSDDWQAKANEALVFAEDAFLGI